MSDWTVTGPDGTEYTGELQGYEADQPGQIGNPFVKTSTPVLRCIPIDRCAACHGTGDQQNPYEMFGCRWCDGGSCDPTDDYDLWVVQRMAFISIIAAATGRSVDEVYEEAETWL